MDPLATLEFARALIDIDSTTGRERAPASGSSIASRALATSSPTQRVDADRFNVLAILDSADVVFSTHFDCVPPFIRQPGRRSAAVRAWSVRRQRHSGSTARGGRAAEGPGRAEGRPALRGRRGAGQ